MRGLALERSGELEQCRQCDEDDRGGYARDGRAERQHRGVPKAEQRPDGETVLDLLAEEGSSPALEQVA